MRANEVTQRSPREREALEREAPQGEGGAAGRVTPKEDAQT